MDKVRCVGGLKPEDLTVDNKAKLQMFVKAGEKSGLIGIDCFSNLDTSMEEEVPSGTIFYFSPNAVVDPTLISDNLFQQLAISKIVEAPYEKELNNAHFTSNAKAIQSAIPPLIGEELTITNGVETGPWVSELSGASSFVGIFSQMSDDHQTKDYYVVGKATAPTSVIQHLKQEMNKHAPTYGQLLRDPEWTKQIAEGNYLASRNVNRNLAQTAEAYNVGIGRMPDFSSVTKDASHGVGERSQPNYTQKVYSIQEVQDVNGNKLVAFYNGVIPASSTVNKDKYFLVSNPAKDGIYVFPITSYSSGGGSSFSGIPADSPKGMNKTVKQVMKTAGGWNPEDHVGIMVPVVVKTK